MPLYSQTITDPPGGLCYLGHSWTAGIGVTTTGTPRFQRQGFMGRLAAMMHIHENNLKPLATAGSYLARSRSAYGSPYSGWAAAYAFLGPYSSPNFGDPTATHPVHAAAAQPWPLLICHGINDAAYYSSGHTTLTHAQVRNAFRHALRAVLSKHRSSYEWGSYYNTSGAAAWNSALTFSGTWSNQTVDPSDNMLAGGSGPFRKSSTTTNDYVELTIPSDFQGGTIAMSFVSNRNGKTTLSTASMNNTDVTTAIAVADGATTFPSSGNFRIKMSGSSEEMLVTAGQGTNNWTVTRGHNGTTKTTHASGEQITMLDTGIQVAFSTSGTNPNITGTQVLQGQGAMGSNVAVVKRFACTSADAGKTIRATISGLVSGDTHASVQFDACWLESPDPPPAVIENVPRWLASSVIPYAYLSASNYADYNTDIDTIVAEFDNRVRVADIDGPMWNQCCYPTGSWNNTDVTTTANVTVNDPATWSAMGTGWILQRGGEQMLVTANTLVSGSTYSITVTRGYNSTSKITHSSTTLMGAQKWMHTDQVHPNAVGHTARAQIIFDAFQSVYAGLGGYSQAAGQSADTQDTRTQHMGITDNWYQQPPTGGALTANTTFTKDKQWYFPIFVPERAVLTSVGIVTGTSAGTATNARFGIYAPGINRSSPANLIRELGTTATTSTTTAQEVATYLVLEPGMYWVSVVNQGTTAGGVRTCTGANWVGFSPVYVSAIPTGTSLSYFFAETGVTGSCPSSATPVADAGPIPFVWVKFRKPPYL